MKLNLACGSTYIPGDGWVNFDFAPLSPSVRQADLLRPLPIREECADIIYTSHFLEHIPRDLVSGFLQECRRLLKPGGTVRIVVPDLENICRNYIAERDAGRHDRADFLVLELLDQCVRKESGGQLGRFYSVLAAEASNMHDMASFVTERTGHILADTDGCEAAIARKRPSFADRVVRKVSSLKIKAALALLPPAFRAQNVSTAEVGEIHQWMWDFHMLRDLLLDNGFVDVTRYDSQSSGIENFPVKELDLDTSGRPRKGDASMYVEARKAPG